MNPWFWPTAIFTSSIEAEHGLQPRRWDREQFPSWGVAPGYGERWPSAKTNVLKIGAAGVAKHREVGVSRSRVTHCRQCLKESYEASLWWRQAKMRRTPIG